MTKSFVFDFNNLEILSMQLQVDRMASFRALHMVSSIVEPRQTCRSWPMCSSKRAMDILRLTATDLEVAARISVPDDHRSWVRHESLHGNWWTS
jgi:hypothetical protein